MKDFTDWYVYLIEDERFYENASRNHRKETVESTARKIYEVATVDRDMFEITSIAEHRKHLLFKLYKIPADKVKKSWHEIALEEKEKEKKASEPEWVPTTPERRERWLKVFAWRVGKISPPERVRKITNKEIVEEGQWDKKKVTEMMPSKIEQIISAREHFIFAQNARRKLFKHAYPDAAEEEVKAYTDQFLDIDDPLGIGRKEVF